MSLVIYSRNEWMLQAEKNVGKKCSIRAAGRKVGFCNFVKKKKKKDILCHCRCKGKVDFRRMY